MRSARLLAAALAATLAALALPGTAHAALIPQPFAADSGDACPYGLTAGTLDWNFSTSPLPVRGVAVLGRLVDRPLPADPGRICLDDGYSSAATFVAYFGRAEVGRQAVSADNAVVPIGLRFMSEIDRIVVQVCRDPVRTLPPSYCGKAVEYPAPPLA
jgi:hypothetical protein